MDTLLYLFWEMCFRLAYAVFFIVYVVCRRSL